MRTGTAEIRSTVGRLYDCKDEQKMKKPKIIKYTDGYRYQLAEDYEIIIPIKPAITIFSDFITLTPAGLLTIHKGYAWDGPSGPTWDTPAFMRGALVHDVIYQLCRQGHLSKSYRRAADELLRAICIEDGMWRIRAWYVYHAVRLFAGDCADPSHRKPILSAP